jgi:hypothetical protein
MYLLLDIAGAFGAWAGFDLSKFVQSFGSYQRYKNNDFVFFIMALLSSVVCICGNGISADKSCVTTLLLVCLVQGLNLFNRHILDELANVSDQISLM